MNAQGSTRFGCLLAVVFAALVTLPEVRSQTPHEALLQQAESRFRAIYDRNEYRPQSFRVDWQSDSSGYTVLESVPDAKEKARVRYDVVSGERTVRFIRPSLLRAYFEPMTPGSMKIALCSGISRSW